LENLRLLTLGNRLDWLGWFQANIISIISLLSTVVLLVLNGVYIYLTKKTLDATIRQSNLAYNPVIGIRLGEMYIGKTFGPSRRNMNVGLYLTNVGNAPAIDVLVDAEIILEYSSINGEKRIPARFEPARIPFIGVGEEVDDYSIYPNFGNICITHILDDFRERSRLNTLRIETDPTREPYTATRLKIYVYYRNSIGQYFESTYETHLDLDKIPKENEAAEIHQIYIPRPKFYVGPISKEKMDKEISERNAKRDLCGW